MKILLARPGMTKTQQCGVALLVCGFGGVKVETGNGDIELADFEGFPYLDAAICLTA